MKSKTHVGEPIQAYIVPSGDSHQVNETNVLGITLVELEVGNSWNPTSTLESEVSVHV